MGIPHLIASLERFSTLEELSGQCVVIDGPAFAYHIYYICLASRSHARRPFEAMPSYAEIGEVALQWLDGLREAQVTIEKIYFDGFLPPSKLDTRLGRLISTTRRMSDFYHSNQVVSIPVSPVRTTTSLYAQSSVPSRLSTLPPIPFHVPAVIEALRESSRYGSITQVIPGEADLYCSKYLSQNGGIVLTGDSDLLVHTLGPMGKVLFFKDMGLSSSPLEVVNGQIYWPCSIARELGLPASHGLTSVAFEMKMDPYSPFSNHVSSAKKLKAIQAHKSMYEDFQEEYQALENDPPLNRGTDSAASVLQVLDPRISEYVLQFPSLAKLSGQETNQDSSSTARIFLPFLLDTPEQTSTWEMATSVRQLAYGLINLVVPKNQQKMTIYEHKKQKDKSQGRELALPDVSEIAQACDSIVKLLNQLHDRLPNLSEQDMWTAVAVHQDVEWAHLHSRKALSKTACHQMLNENSKNTATWDVVQFFAQTQASYYSFRILKQISGLVISCSEKNLPEAVRELHQKLETLPKLAQLQNLAEVASIVKLVDSVSFVVHTLLGLDGKSVPAVSKREAKRKRKEERDTALKSRPRSSNPFDILDVE